MEILQFFGKYPIPTSVVSTIFVMWAISKFVFPYLGGISDWFMRSKDAQIKDLTIRLTALESNYTELSNKLNKTEARENQMLGLLRGLSYQLKTVGVDVDAEIDKIINP